MLEEQVNELATIIKDEDLKEYTGDAFWDLIAAVISKDPVAGASAVKNVHEIIFHMPTLIFWDKFKRFLNGTYKDYEEQVKMAARFNDDNKKYVEFVKRQIQLINKLDDDSKVDYFAMLTRCLLLQEIDISLYFKLASILNQCTCYELEYIKSTDENKKMKNDAIVSALYQYGLVEGCLEDEGFYYVFSGYAKALKRNCLNYEDDTCCEVLKTYEDIKPLGIPEPIPDEDIESLFKEK